LGEIPKKKREIQRTPLIQSYWKQKEKVGGVTVDRKVGGKEGEKITERLNFLFAFRCVRGKEGKEVGCAFNNFGGK